LQDIGLLPVTASLYTEDEDDDEDDSKFRNLGLGFRRCTPRPLVYHFFIFLDLRRRIAQERALPRLNADRAGGVLGGVPTSSLEGFNERQPVSQAV
jgi:hypothetical protein